MAAGRGAVALAAAALAALLTAAPATAGPSTIEWRDARAHRSELVRLRGPVTAVERAGGEVRFTIGHGEGRVVVTAPASLAHAFPPALARSYEGQEVEVRGFIEARDGLGVQLAAPGQIRIVTPAAKPDLEARVRSLAERVERLEAEVEKLHGLLSGPARTGSRTYGPNVLPPRALARGMSAAEVRARRGLPDRVERRPHGETWWYGRERLDFDAQRLLVGQRRGG